VERSLWVGDESLPQVEEFKYLVGVRDGQTDRGFVSSNEGAAPVRCGEEGAEPEGEAFRLLLHLCSNPHLWSQIWVLTQRMRSWIQAAEISSLQRGGWEELGARR